MPHHIQTAGPLPHSHPSPWRPSLQALGPPIWAVSAGRSHPELSEWMLLALPPPTPTSRLELWVWAGTVALDCPHLGLCHTGFPSGATGNRVGKGEEAPCAYSPPQKQQVQGARMRRRRAESRAASAVGPGPGTLILWASLLQVDKSISEITEA